MKVKANLGIFLSYIVLILCVMNCNTIYSTSNNIDFRLSELTILFLLALVYVEAKFLPIAIIKKWFICLIPYFLWNIVIIFTSVTMGRLTGYVIRFFLFIPLFSLLIMIYIQHEKIWTLLIRLKNIIFVYAIISLILWVLVCILNVLPEMGSIECGWGENYDFPLYFGIFTVRQQQNFLGINWMRNMGFFTEGPMYNLVLLTAILIEVFIVPLEKNVKGGLLKGIDLRKLAILVIADITTFTTTGLILIIGIFVLKYGLMKSKSSIESVVKWLAGIFIAIIALYVMYALFLGKADTGSWEVRSDDIVAGIKAWSDHILLGNGYDSMEAIENHMSSYRLYNMGYSSGLFAILAQGGLLLFLNYAVSAYGFIKQSLRMHRYELITFLTIYIIILITTIFQNSFLMMFILAYGYALIPDIENRGNMNE